MRGEVGRRLGVHDLPWTSADDVSEEREESGLACEMPRTCTVTENDCIWTVCLVRGEIERRLEVHD